MFAMPATDGSTLLECLLHWERQTPDAIYLTQPLPGGAVVDYSWREVGRQVRAMAAHLQSLQLPPQSRIALLGKNSAHWIMADLAIWMAGQVTVPLYPALNAETAAYVLEHSGAQLLFLGRMEAEGWQEIERVLPSTLPLIALPLAPRADGLQWEKLIERSAPLQQVELPAAEALATILYTSGSTGRPKGVMHSHGNLVRAVDGLDALTRATPADRMLSYLPLAHVAERVAVEAASLVHGFRVFFSDSLATFPQDLRRARPTVFFSVPRLWTKFQQGVNHKLPEQKLRRLLALPIVSGIVRRKILTQLGLQDTRLAITGSAPLPAVQIAWYRRLGLELIELYGMTENLAYSHGGRPGQLREGYIGHAQPGVEARIAADGELQVKSPCQMLGYYREPEKTAAEMTGDGWFRTGDRGEIDAQGRLRITGRVKELFKTAKGKYVAPAPIENRLGSQSTLESVCVTGPGLPQPFALLALAPEVRKAIAAGADRGAIQRELEALLQRVNAALEDHEKLDYAVVVSEPWTIEAGLLTPTLKIKRSAIEQRYLPQAEAWSQLRQAVIWE